MTLTLLLDLDDTLLGNSMDTFLPVYFQAIGKHLSHFAPPGKLLPLLLRATREMVENDRLDRSLKQVFDQAFFPALGFQPEEVQESIDAFYAEVFPTLRSVTQPRPEAVELVWEAIARKYCLVLATSPLFPRTAIVQRLTWAGLSPEDFSLIPSYETNYFAKPNPAYFAELLAGLGWPEGPVVMVGDDFYSDILPARKAGIATYWISAEPRVKPDDSSVESAGGKLGSLLDWLKSASEEELQPEFDQPDAILAILRATPAALASLFNHLPLNAWTASPGTGEWSPAEILCHLRDVESEVNLPRTVKVLQEFNPFLPGMDTDPWAKERNYIVQEGLTALKDFTNCRQELVNLLASLPARDWDRPARHAIFGPTHLGELSGIVASHDRLHLRQIFETIGTIRSHAQAYPA